MSQQGAIRVRPASPADVELIFSMIVELAEYERAPEQVAGSPELLAEALFGPEPSAEAVVAEMEPRGSGVGTPVGFALFHGNFSTWECRPGLWLEDLYVPPEHRRLGVGRRLFTEVARIAVERGCTRLEWAALGWNTPALDFYAGLGAERLEEWRMHRLDSRGLRRVAQRGSGART